MPELVRPDAFPPPDPAARHVLDGLRAAGFESYFVGGCVRDLLLGIPPKDWDIATAARPEEVEALFERTVPVGRAFGVMLVVVDGEDVEVATFRADTAESDGRRPEGVRFCGAREDVQRRDFTVNGLLYDPARNEVLDHVGGRDDLAAGRIRAIGEPVERMCEDYLRLLRAVRFAARLDFSLEASLAEAMRTHAGLVRLVSAERVGAELERMLTGAHPDTAVRMLHAHHLLVHTIPEIEAMVGMPQPPAFHPEGSVWAHTLEMLGALGPDPDPALAWATLLHDVGKPGTLSVRGRIRFDNHPAVGARIAEDILRRLKRPGKLIEAVSALVQGHMRLTHIREMRTARRRRMVRDPLFPLHLELHRLDCLASHRKMDLYDYAREAHREEQATPDPPEPLLTGQDLIALGLTPGPAFRRILDAVEDARLEGEVETPADARDWVLRRWRDLLAAEEAAEDDAADAPREADSEPDG